MPQFPTDLRRVAGIVLGAGASRRMGTNKMLLELEGEPLVRRATLRAIASGLSPVVVVVGHERELVSERLADLDCEVVYNPDYEGPSSTSLHRGLEELPRDVDAVVIVLGDMVFVTEAMIRALIPAAVQSGAPLAVSRYGDVTAPPLLFRRALFRELLAWNGEGCGKAVVRRYREQATYLDWPVAALADVDTPVDFAAVSAGSELESRPD